MTEFLTDLHLSGLTIGLLTFLVIGLFHPIVIKAEYYFGVACWWWFLVTGIICCIISLMISDIMLSSILGVVAFSSFWSIKEIFEQRERVRKGWFPENPNRTKTNEKRCEE